MRANLIRVGLFGVALGMGIWLAGCSKSSVEEYRGSPTSPTNAPAATAGSAPPSKPMGGGSVPPINPTLAPSNVQTGNFAGGRK